jgi:hypothetical protein
MDRLATPLDECGTGQVAGARTRDDVGAWGEIRRSGLTEARREGRSLMQRRNVAAWISFTAALGAGIGLLWWTHAPARAKAENGRAGRVEPQPGHTAEEIRPGETGQIADEYRSQRDGDGRMRQASSDGSPSPAMPSPPLPSRVLPGPLPEMQEGKPRASAFSSSTPPVPTKTLPGPIPGDGHDPSDAPSESNSPDVN